MTLIFDVIGSPKPEDVGHINNTQAKKFLESQGNKKPQSLHRLYPSASAEAIDVLSSLLIFNPEDRFTVGTVCIQSIIIIITTTTTIIIIIIYILDEALACDFLSDLDKSHEPLTLSSVYPEVSPDFEFHFEREDLSRQQLRSLIKREADSFKTERYNNTDMTTNTNTSTATRATSTRANGIATNANPDNSAKAATANSNSTSNSRTNTNTNTTSTSKRSNRYDNPILVENVNDDEEKMRLIKALLDTKKTTKFTHANSISNTISKHKRLGLDDDKGMAYLTNAYNDDNTKKTTTGGRPVSSTRTASKIATATTTNSNARPSTKVSSTTATTTAVAKTRTRSTVPQSPKFSTLSWQRAQYPTTSAAATTTTTAKATSRLTGMGIASDKAATTTAINRSRSAGITITITTSTATNTTPILGRVRETNTRYAY